MSVVVCFSGGIGSGKTSLAAEIASRLGVGMASFGDFVRSAARARGLPLEREALQALGASLIEEMTFDGFCRAVLAAAGWTSGSTFVVDGIRHVGALDSIKNVVAPVPVKLLLINLERDARQARADRDENREKVDMAKVDQHSTEKDVHGALRERADMILDGHADLASLVAQVEQLVRTEA